MTLATKYTNAITNVHNSLLINNKPRVITQLWKIMLLHNLDQVEQNGNKKQIIAKSLGAGVYELSLKD